MNRKQKILLVVVLIALIAVFSFGQVTGYLNVVERFASVCRRMEDLLGFALMGILGVGLFTFGAVGSRRGWPKQRVAPVMLAGVMLSAVLAGALTDGEMEIVPTPQGFTKVSEESYGDTLTLAFSGECTVHHALFAFRTEMERAGWTHTAGDVGGEYCHDYYERGDWTAVVQVSRVGERTRVFIAATPEG